MRFQKTGAAASRRRAGWAAFRGWASALRIFEANEDRSLDGDVRDVRSSARRSRQTHTCVVFRFAPQTSFQALTTRR